MVRRADHPHGAPPGVDPSRVSAGPAQPLPLRRDLVRLYRIPRFIPWCGARATEDWHTRFPVDVVVHGHLHMRATDWRDGVRFEEVAVGYPRHWRAERGFEGYLRTILPRVPAPPQGEGGPVWHR